MPKLPNHFCEDVIYPQLDAFTIRTLMLFTCNTMNRHTGFVTDIIAGPNCHMLVPSRSQGRPHQQLNQMPLFLVNLCNLLIYGIHKICYSFLDSWYGLSRQPHCQCRFDASLILLYSPFRRPLWQARIDFSSMYYTTSLADLFVKPRLTPSWLVFWYVWHLLYQGQDPLEHSVTKYTIIFDTLSLFAIRYIKQCS